MSIDHSELFKTLLRVQVQRFFLPRTKKRKTYKSIEDAYDGYSSCRTHGGAMAASTSKVCLFHDHLQNYGCRQTSFVLPINICFACIDADGVLDTTASTHPL